MYGLLYEPAGIKKEIISGVIRHGNAVKSAENVFLNKAFQFSIDFTRENSYIK